MRLDLSNLYSEILLIRVLSFMIVYIFWGVSIISEANRFFYTDCFKEMIIFFKAKYYGPIKKLSRQPTLIQFSGELIIV